MSLTQLAEHMGLKVERRPVTLEEIESFEEVGACGTAAVISPIKKIVDRETGKVFEYCKDGNAGPISTKLYKKLQGIQCGEDEDIFNWTLTI